MCKICDSIEYFASPPAEQYDLSMLTSALKFIAADLGMAESDLGGYASLMRLGALPAFIIIPFADRIGRRRLFLASVDVLQPCGLT